MTDDDEFMRGLAQDGLQLSQEPFLSSDAELAQLESENFGHTSLNPPQQDASTVAHNEDDQPRVGKDTGNSAPSTSQLWMVNNDLNQTLLNAARITLARYNGWRHTPISQTTSSIDVNAVVLPSVFSRWVTHQNVPRGRTFALNDLSTTAFIYDASQKSTIGGESANSREDVPSTENQKGKASSTPKETKVGWSLNHSIHHVRVVDQPQVIQEGVLLKQTTTWDKKKSNDAKAHDEIRVVIYYLVSAPLAADIQAFVDAKNKSKREGGSSKRQKTGEAARSQTLTEEKLGPALCVVLPKQEEAREVSWQDVEGVIFSMLQSKEGFCRQRDDLQEIRKRNLRAAVSNGLASMLESLKAQKDVEWPDYVFKPEFILPSIQFVHTQAMEQGHLPGIISEAMISAGDFEPRREIASILKYVEFYLLYLKAHEDRFDALENLIHQHHGRYQTLVGQVSAMQSALDDEGRDIVARVWKDKFAFPPRPYQVSAVEHCIAENTIVCLETGRGKTLIAIKCIDHYLGTAADKGVLFIVPTRALVSQQAAAIRKHSIALPSSPDPEHSFTGGVAELCGNRMDGWALADWTDCLSKFRVLVGTPDVFKRACVTTGFLDVAQLSLIVFDECHNAVGDSAMACVMRDGVSLAPPPDRPRIVGLTASPVHSSVTEMKVKGCIRGLRSTLHAQLFVPSVAAEQERARTHETVAWEAGPTTEQDAHGVAESVMNPLLEACELVQAVRKPAAIVKSAAHVLGQLGMEALRYYILQGVAVEVEARARQLAECPAVQVDSEPAGQTSRDAAIALLENLPVLTEQLRQRFAAMWAAAACPPAESPWSLRLPESTNKLDTLVELLLSIQREGAGQGIVFCERNSVVHPIKHRCLREGLPAEAVAGVQSMSDTRRQDALAKFRDKTVLVLVATAAVEEGLDVADCKFVVRFDEFHTTKSHIQGSGRARAGAAKIYYMENVVQDEQDKEKMLRAATEDPLVARSEQIHGAPPGIRGKYPYPTPSDDGGVAAAGEGVVVFSNCRQIYLSEYCQCVLAQTVEMRELLQYSKPADPSLRPVLETCRFPSPDGWISVSREQVEEYWAGAESDLALLLPHRDCAEQKRFLFVVVVKMRQGGVLDEHNKPTAQALLLCRQRCPFPAFPSSLDITPKFQDSPGPLSFSSAAGSNGVCSSSALTWATRLDRERKALGRIEYEFTRSGQQGFVCVVGIPELALTSEGPICASKKAAKQAAARIAWKQVSQRSSVKLKYPANQLS